MNKLTSSDNGYDQLSKTNLGIEKQGRRFPDPGNLRKK